MSVWSKILSIGAAAAAPFTGGASMALPAVLGAAGAVASGAAKSSADNRGAKIASDIDAEKVRQAGEQALFDELLNREKLKEAAAGEAWKRQQQADFVSNYQPRVSSNLTPYARAIAGPSDAMREAATDPAMAAALRARTNYTYDPFEGRDPNSLRMSDDVLSRIRNAQKSSIWEKILGVAGPALTLYGAAKTPQK